MDILLYRVNQIIAWFVFWLFICFYSTNVNGDNDLTQRINEFKLNYQILTQKWNELIYHANKNGLQTSFEKCEKTIKSMLVFGHGIQRDMGQMGNDPQTSLLPTIRSATALAHQIIEIIGAVIFQADLATAMLNESTRRDK
nr:unnamed protein product [Fasciola hepatica]